jgi:hypothetical protein
LQRYSGFDSAEGVGVAGVAFHLAYDPLRSDGKACPCGGSGKLRYQVLLPLRSGATPVAPTPSAEVCCVPGIPHTGKKTTPPLPLSSPPAEIACRFSGIARFQGL